MKVLVSYTIKAVIKNHRVSVRQRVGAWIVTLGVWVIGGKTYTEFETIERTPNLKKGARE